MSRFDLVIGDRFDGPRWPESCSPGLSLAGPERLPKVKRVLSVLDQGAQAGCAEAMGAFRGYASGDCHWILFRSKIFDVRWVP